MTTHEEHLIADSDSAIKLFERIMYSRQCDTVVNYQKLYQLYFFHKGEVDSVYSNGQILGPYQGAYFIIRDNIITNYFE